MAIIHVAKTNYIYRPIIYIYYFWYCQHIVTARTVSHVRVIRLAYIPQE